ncbi:bifunctional rhamnulose-1-phosphate aldolase/short-chain dehydrogenase [Fodinicurvata sp. EGI_FJ10296]|uniref:bifunctional rhamnulose-1-phosphate aldolase/short-chain dehydrogenase n=1 Tax=Fodinicurvata sp. EGI_FJ10296 TaxID=3231908 RepID=UPI003455DFD1
MTQDTGQDTRMPPLDDHWDDRVAADLDEPGQLLYRSNLLGRDKRITNYGGGNTSAKIPMRDPLTREMVDVLWVKGSGGDLGSMDLGGFSTLYLDKLEQIKQHYRGIDHEDEMVGFLPHCTFNQNPRAASIDTPLHAYLPYRHVDHVHPDAVIAIAAASRGEELTTEIFGGELGWLPWQRPGFDLGLKLERLAKENPNLTGVVLGGHGLFTWGETARDCYRTTLRIIQKAADWLAANESAPAFGGERVAARPADERARIASALMPEIRGLIGAAKAKIGHFTDAPEVLTFVNSQRLHALAPLGTSCPDHFLRTKIRPLVLEPGAEGRVDGLPDALEAYRQDYRAYYERCRHSDSPAIRDPNPVVYLVPGVGMITFAGDKATARIAAEFYTNAINVMRGADGVDEYVGLDEQEAFNIEYWLLEEAKLQRMPKQKAMAGRVAVVTGGAGGIGMAAARRLLAESACVVLADVDAEGVTSAVETLAGESGADRVAGVSVDVTDEARVTAMIDDAARLFGGIDVVVSNAGIASSAPLDETSLALWNRNMDILSTGYFLVARESFKLMKRQGIGGSMVFVASKNGLVASANASAYCTAKAAEIQLARSVALEGAPHGIRVNTVNPDAVIRGSRIWTGKWKEERAQAYGIGEDDLEEHYRNRSLLKRSVLPEDVAEAIYFLASEQAAKSTGNIINVDAGHPPSFTR